MLLLALAATSLILSLGFVTAAPHVPKRAAIFEQWGGTLFLAGLGLLGAVMPWTGGA